MRDNGEWAPARNVHDTKAPPSKFGANLAEQPMTRADVMALMQSGFAKKQERPCHICGSTDHWKNDCTEKDGKKNNRERNQRQNGQQTRHKSWKLIPPNPGQPQTKQSDTGRTFDWCATCKRWTASHGTDSHTGKSDKDKGKDKSSNEANMCLVPDPFAWIAEFPLAFTFGIPSLLLAMFVGALSMFVGALSMFFAVGDVTSIWVSIVNFCTFAS